jgi:hypothetical protein
MTKGVQFRRGTTGQHDLFSGAEGEITVDTEKKIAVVQDGAKSGGYPLVGTGVTQTLSNKQFSGVTTFTNADNSATVSIGIGTTSGIALKITHNGTGPALVVEDVTNDATPFFIDATGNVGIGTTVTNYLLSVVGSGVTATTSGLSGVLAEFTGTSSSYSQINLRNAEGISTTSSADFIVTADIGTDTTNYIDFGINNGGFSPNLSNEGWSINGALDGYLYSQTGGLSIGVAATTGGKRLSLFVGGLQAQNERVAITTVGVGIGTTNPVAQLQIGSLLTNPITGFGSFAVIDNFGRIGIGTTNLTQNSAIIQVGAADTTSVVIVDNTGDVGIGTNRPTAKIHASLSRFTPAGIAGIFSGSTTSDMVQIFNLGASGNALRVGVGSTAVPTLLVAANSITNSPGTVGVGSVGFGTAVPNSLVDIYGSVNVTDGPGGLGIVTTNQLRIKQTATTGALTSAIGVGSTGTIQHTFDGLLVFSSGVGTHGKQLIPTQAFHRITPDRTAIAAASAAGAYFGAATPLAPSGLYEIEYNLYYSRQFAGVTTFRVTNTAANAAVVSLDATSTSGISTIGQIGIVQAVAHAPTTMSATNPGLGFSFSNGTSNFAKIRVFAQNTNSATTLRLDVQNSNSTLTPLANSTWKSTYLGDVSSVGIGLTA